MFFIQSFIYLDQTTRFINIQKNHTNKEIKIKISFVAIK